MKMKSAKIFFTALVIIFLGCSWLNISETKTPWKKPHNIILFIGDGMGTAQLSYLNRRQYEGQ